MKFRTPKTDPSSRVTSSSVRLKCAANCFLSSELQYCVTSKSRLLSFHSRSFRTAQASLSHQHQTISSLLSTPSESKSPPETMPSLIPQVSLPPVPPPQKQPRRQGSDESAEALIARFVLVLLIHYEVKLRIVHSYSVIEMP